MVALVYERCVCAMMRTTGAGGYEWMNGCGSKFVVCVRSSAGKEENITIRSEVVSFRLLVGCGLCWFWCFDMIMHYFLIYLVKTGFFYWVGKLVYEVWAFIMHYIESWGLLSSACTCKYEIGIVRDHEVSLSPCDYLMFTWLVNDGSVLLSFPCLSSLLSPFSFVRPQNGSALYVTHIVGANPCVQSRLPDMMMNAANPTATLTPP